MDIVKCHICTLNAIMTVSIMWWTPHSLMKFLIKVFIENENKMEDMKTLHSGSKFPVLETKRFWYGDICCQTLMMNHANSKFYISRMQSIAIIVNQGQHENNYFKTLKKQGKKTETSTL